MTSQTPYIYEMMAILSHANKTGKEQDREDADSDELGTETEEPAQYSLDKNIKIKRHIVIKNFLALSTVLEAARDVGAVAVYEYLDHVQVYYGKIS